MFEGIYKGSVVNSDDPENRGRAILLIPQVLADQPSAWAEPIISSSHKHKPGDVVWVQFLEGDPSRPVYQSRGGMIQTFYQDTAPTGNFQIGDLWFDTDDDNHRYEWDGTDWAESVRDLDAGEINRGALDPTLIQTGAVSFVPLDVQVVPASEALVAGDLVNIWDDEGTFKARKANAVVTTGVVKAADGFVTDDVALGEMAVVRLTGHLVVSTWQMVPGDQFLADDGAVTDLPPSTAGRVVHRVGFAVSPTTLSFQPRIPIVIT